MDGLFCIQLNNLGFSDNSIDTLWNELEFKFLLKMNEQHLFSLLEDI